jgi:WD40 repeat protein
MGMQYDVKAAHLNASGIAVSGPNRLKGLIYTSGTSAGTINIWDTVTAPTAITSYTRAAAVITVTLASHGLTTGDVIGLTFSSGTGGYGTNGNYVVTVLTSSTYTVTDINSGTITSGIGGTQTAAGGRWMFSLDTAATTTSGQAATSSILIPGEGIRANTGIYCQLGTAGTNQNGVTVFYG